METTFEHIVDHFKCVNDIRNRGNWHDSFYAPSTLKMNHVKAFALRMGKSETAYQCHLPEFFYILGILIDKQRFRRVLKGEILKVLSSHSRSLDSGR